MPGVQSGKVSTILQPTTSLCNTRYKTTIALTENGGRRTKQKRLMVEACRETYMRVRRTGARNIKL